MEEPSRNQTSPNQPSLNPRTSHPTFLIQDMFIDTEPSSKPENLSLSSSSIPPTNTVSWSTQIQKQKKKPTDYESDRVKKYTKYFKNNEILPIPELVQDVEPKTLSFVVTDIKTMRLGNLKKRNFRRDLKERRHPREIHLQKRFCNLGCLATRRRIS